MGIGAVGRARAWGLDISLLRSCLERTPESRLRLACGNATAVARIRRRPADFEALLDRLVIGKVRFVLVGSMAAAAHGSAYVPNDLDICYDAGDETLVRLASVLNPIDPRPLQDDLVARSCLDATTFRRSPDVALRTRQGDLDLLAAVVGMGDYADCLAASEPVEWGATAVRVLAPEGLIIALEVRDDATETGPLLPLQAARELNREEWRGYGTYVHRF